MQTILLTVDLILAIALIIVVLLQRSEGGGLGIGGGGQPGAGRPAANPLTRVTWILGAAFFATSIGLTVISARDAGNSSVIDNLAPAAIDPTAPLGETLDGDLLLPPSPEDAPAAPPKAE